MERINFQIIEKKWQEYFLTKKLYQKNSNAKNLAIFLNLSLLKILMILLRNVLINGLGLDKNEKIKGKV